jgi:hypothetical protein
MNPPAAAALALHLFRASGMDGAGILRACAELIALLEKDTTCDRQEILTLLRRVMPQEMKNQHP